MPTEQVVYLDGTWGPISEARISVLDRGFIFGDGVYEVVPAYRTEQGACPFRLENHLQRLARSLKRVRISNPFSPEQWRALIMQALKANPVQETSCPGSLVYMQITRGVAKRAHAFPAQSKPTVFIMVSPLSVPSATDRERGVAAVTANDERWLNCDIKSTSLLANVLMAQYAVENGAAETIQLRNGYLTEGSSSNVWVVKGGHVLAPPRDHLILEGIRYALLEELCTQAGIPFDVRPVSEAELHSADEIMLSSASKEVLPVTTLDGKPVGNGRPGPVFTALYAGYQQMKERVKAEWLQTSSGNKKD